MKRVGIRLLPGSAFNCSAITDRSMTTWTCWASSARKRALEGRRPIRLTVNEFDAAHDIVAAAAERRRKVFASPVSQLPVPDTEASRITADEWAQS